MNPLDEAWLILKGVLGGAEDKANVDEQTCALYFKILIQTILMKSDMK